MENNCRGRLARHLAQGKKVARRLLAVLVVPTLALAGVVATPTPAAAVSPGCAVVNGGFLDQSGTPLLSNRVILGAFYPGEVLTMTFSASAPLPLSVVTLSTTGPLSLSTSINLPLTGTGPFSRTLTITGNGALGAEAGILAAGSILGVNVNLTVRCAGVIAPTATTVATTTNPTVVGQAATFTATVATPAGSSHVPTGNVNFNIGGTNYGPVALNSSGVATYSTTTLPQGTYAVSATYAGAADFSTSSGTLSTSQTVNRANTTTTVAASASPTFGSPVTFTATTAAVAPGGGTPTGSVIFTIGGTDQAPVALSNGSATLTLSNLPAGNTSVSARYTQTAGYNASSGSLSGGVTLAAAPTTTTVTQTNPTSTIGDTVNFRAMVSSGAGQPTGNVVFTIDGTPRTAIPLSSGVAEISISNFTVGAHTVSAAYQGTSSFAASSGTLSAGHTVTTRPTTTTLSGPGSIAFGQSATITATVAGAGGPPTGSVVFTVDGQAQPAVTLSGGTASITLPALSVGGHTISASYGGAATFAPSSGTLTGGQTVTTQPTTTTLAGPGAIAFGASATITATVASSSGTPTGSVVFTVDGQARPAVALNNGTASINLTGLAVGDHTVSAAYSGSTNYATSTGSLAGGQPVTAASTALTLVGSPAIGTFGNTATFTASVTSAAGVPAGNVIFTIDGVAQPAVALAGGTAALSTTTLSVGNHTVTAAYEGNTSYLASTGSLASAYPVGRATPSLSVLSSASPSAFGQTVQFTANMSSAAGVPTGSVVFTIDGNALPAVTMSNGSASVSVPALPVGDHAVSVRYSGDTNFVERTGSLSGGQRVNAGNTSLTVTADTANAAFGTPVTISADLAVTAPASGAPTGQIVFMVDGTAQAPVPVAGGRAQLTLQNLAPGAHTISAAYQGGTEFNASSGTLAGGVTIARAETTTALALDSTSISLGQSARATATVTAPSGTPTGTVVFTVNGTARPAVTVQNGHASLDLPTPSVGQYTITAAYSGSTNHLASTSATAQLSVGAAATQLNLSASTQSVRFGEPVTLTAGITSAGGTPDGTIEFLANGSVIGTGTLSGGSASFTTSALPFGSASITARYAGTGSFSASTATLAQPIAVAGRQPEIAVTVAPASTSYGTDVTATITVSSPAGTPAGAVTLTIGGTDYPATLVNGSASVTVTGLPPGSHAVSVSYAGQSPFLGASATGTPVTITRASSTVALTADPVALSFGQDLSLQAAVTSTFGTPSGGVVFTVDGTDYPATLASGMATASVQGLLPGNHSVSVRYLGSTTHAPAEATLDGAVAVSAATTALDLSTSTPSISFGGTAPVTATVSSPAAGLGGNVVFVVDGRDHQTVAVANGAASTTLSGLTVGNHAITARLVPAAGFATATAELAGGIAVIAALPSVTITPPAGSVTVGEIARFAVTVGSAAGTPGGSIIPVIDGVDQAPVTLSAGTASFDAMFLTSGNHTVAVRYSGNDSFAAATGTLAGGVSVSGSTSSISLAADPATPVFGQPVTVTATVGAGFGMPGGIVVFSRGGIELASVPLVNGSATLTLGDLAPGSTTITAAYAGDAARLPSQGSLAIAVSDAATAIALSAEPRTLYAGAPVTFTAAVSSDAGPVTGQVAFTVGGTDHAATISGGVATLTLTDLAQGTYAVAARFEGSPGFAPSTGSLSADLVVEPTPTDIVVSATLPRAVAGEALAIGVTATGGVAPYRFAVTDGALPDGVTLDAATGAISGTPTTPGTYRFSVTASGVAGAPGTAAIELVVLSPAALVVPQALDGGVYGESMMLDLSASGGTAPYSYALTGTLPIGVRFDPATATLSGTPTALGSFPLTLTVTDANGFTLTRAYGLDIAAPVLSISADLPEAGAFMPFSGTIGVSGGTGPYSFAVIDGALPDGLALDASTGAISGTPRRVGEATFTVTATDANGFAADLPLSIDVEQVFTVVLPGALADGRQFRSFGQTLAASGGTAPYAYEISTGSLPGGLTLDADTGTITGTPTEPGNFAFTLLATDANGVTGSVDYTLTIAAAATLVTDLDLPSAIAGTPYEADIEISGGAGPYQFTLVSGTVPAGLSFAGGALTGTPTLAGTFPIVVEIVDANGDRVTETVVITVAAPTIVATLDYPAAAAGTAYSGTVSVSGGATPLSFTLTGALPAGLGFDAATGAISGTATEVGTFPLTVTVRDINGFETSGTATLAVTAATTLTLSSDRNAIRFGETATLRADLAAAVGGIAGQVVFSVDGQDRGSVAVSGDSASFALSGLTVGSHTVSARFVPDAGFGASTAQLSGGLSVTAAPVTVAVSGGADAVAGTPTRFSVAVTSSAGVPAGTIIPVVDGVSQAPVPLLNGAATFDLTFATAGSHAVSVRYPGSESFAAALGSVVGGVTVTGAPSQVTLAASPADPIFGQPVTVTATVTSGFNSPGGLVSFSRGGVEIGSVPVVNGTASITLDGLASGSSTITANYRGDASHAAASANIDVTVGDAATSLDLASSATAVFAGAPVNLTATLSSDASQVSGTVIFTVGSTDYNATLTNGTATITLSDLDVGTYPLSVRFDGVPGFATSTATGTDLVVDPAPADVQVYAQVPRSVAGSPLSIEVTATGGIGPYAYVISDGSLPASLTLDPATGAITGTPTTPGLYSFTLTASGTAGAPGSVVIDLLVLQPATLALAADAPAGTYGEAYAFELSPGGGTPPFSFSLSGSLPQGLAFDTATGTISGTPTALGSFALTVTVTDANGFTLAESYDLVIGAPAITLTANLPEAGAFVAYQGEVEVAGGTGPYVFTVADGALPQGLNLDAATGAITGTPRVVGEANFALTVTDANGFSTTLGASISVEQVFTIVLPDDLAPARQFRPFGQVLAASGGTAPYSYAITAGALPDGLLLDAATGTISGTPTGDGSFSFTLTATDANGITGAMSYDLAVATAANLVAEAALPTVTAGAPYAHTLSVSGGTAPYGFALISGTLPSGLSFDSASGTLSGTATAEGTAAFVIRITDANGDTVTQSYVVTVAAPEIEVRIDLPPAAAGEAFASAVSVAGDATPFTFSLTGALPDGLSFDPATGVISGTPSEPGSFALTITATDANGFAQSTSVTLEVTASTTLALTASANAIAFGDSVTVDAQLSSAGPAVVGTVVITVDGRDYASVPVVGGAAQVTISGLTVGSHSIAARFEPNGGYLASTATLAGGISVVAAQTSMSLSASATPAVAGSPVNFTVALTSGAGVPDGSIIPVVDGVDQPAVPLSNGQASFAHTFATLGAHTVSVRYSGSENFAAATASLSAGLTVSGANTSLVLAADPASPLNGQPVTVSATVTSGIGTASGLVTFSRDGVALASVPLANGAASLTLSDLPPGNNAITASYAGDAAHAGSTGALDIDVGDAATRLTLTATPSTLYPGAPLTLIVSISSDAGDVPGSVTFVVAGIDYPVALSNGSAVLTLTDLGEGSYPVSVRYDGEAGFAASETSLVNPITVEPAPTDIVVDAQVGRSVAGEPLDIAITATGGVGPYAFAVTAGTLPAGLSLDPASGVVSGVPTTPGDYTFTVTTSGTAGTPGSVVVAFTVLTPAVIEAPTSLDPVTFGESFAIDLAASGGTQPYDYSLNGTLPAGVSFDPFTGILSGTATALGSFPLTLTITDANGFTLSRSLMLTVAAPTLVISTDLPDAGAFVPYEGAVSVTGGRGAYSYAVTDGALPDGVSLDAASGILSGTPRSVGDATFTIVITDADGFTASVEASIAVRQVFTVTLDANLADARQNRPYGQTVQASGGTAPYAYAISVGALPAGLDLDPATGVLSGTPADAGTFNFALTATDANGVSGALAYQLTVAQAATLVADLDLAQSIAGTPYSETLSISGGTAPYQFALVSGDLPAGLTFDAATGTIAGTATQSGTFPLVVRISDANGDALTQTFVVQSAAPIIDVRLDTASGQTGEPFSATPVVTGGVSPITFSLDGTLPAGVLFDPQTGTISGTPTEAGTFTVTLTATDGNGFTGTVAVQLAIAEPPPPVVIVIAPIDPAPVAGEAYSTTLSASGGTGPYAFGVVSGSLPPGLTLDGSTVSGLPTTPGTYTIVLSVEDSAGNRSEQSITLVVERPVFAPQLPAGLPDATGSQTYEASVAVGGTSLAYAVSAGSLPAGLSLDPTTGRITGTPTAAGASSFDISVTNPFGQVVTASYTIEVSPPALTVAALPPAEGGVAYEATLSPSGGVEPYSFALQSPLPAGLSFDAATGQLSGTPTAAGSFTITVTITDANGFATDVDLTLSIAIPNLTLAGDLPPAQVGRAFSFTPEISGGMAGYSFALIAGDLPAGLNLDPATGTIAGTPTIASSASFTLSVTDANGFSTSRSFSLDVATNVGEAQLPGSLPNAQVGIAYDGTVAASGGRQPLTYAVTAGSLPAGLTLDPATGAITGTPQSAGTALFTITVTDSDGRINAGQFVVTTQPPVLQMAVAVQNGVQGNDYRGSVVVSGGQGPYTYSLANAPRDLTIDPDTGIISGVPRQQGTFELVATATDAGGNVLNRPITITVEQPATLLVLRDIAVTATTGLAYDSSVAVANGNGPVRYALDAGALPDGVALSIETGELSGTPLAVETASFTIRAVDSDGNVGSRSYTIEVLAGEIPDAPVDIALTLSAATVTPGETATLDVSVTSADGPATAGIVSLVDLTSGDVLASAQLDNSGAAQFTLPTDTAGERSYLVRYSGAPGFLAGESAAVTLTVDAPLTTITLTVEPAAPGAGETVDLIANLERSDGSAVAGTVVFLVNGTEVGSVAVSNGVASVQTVLPAGIADITARFEPADNADQPAETSLTITTDGSVTVALSGPQGEANETTPLTYTATVTPSSGGAAPTGSIAFLVNGSQVATANLSNDSATATLDPLAPGSYQVTAVYSGDDTFDTATSNALSITIVTATIAPRGTTTALSPSTATPVIGDPVTLTARVTGSQAAPPTGTVRFIDQTTGMGIGTGTVNSSGQATLVHRFTDTDARTIVAAYQGDSLNLPSSDQILFNVVPSPTQITLEAGTVVVGVNETTTLTAEFGRAPVGRGTPRVEVIEFRADDTVFASVPVNGATEVSVVSPPIGMEMEFTATLVPDTVETTDLPSTSNTVTVGLSAALEPTTTSLSITPDPSVEGATVTLTANVTSAIGAPDGDVDFYQNGTLLGTATLAAGIATLDVTTLLLGSPLIEASYLGTATFSPSGDTRSATVIMAPPPGGASLTLTGRASPSVIVAVGQPVTLTFQVGAVGGTATGIVLTAASMPVTCPAGTLTSGTSMTCTATYLATMDDVAGETVSIPATVTGTGANPASTTVTLTARANEVVESFEDLTQQMMVTRARMITGIALPDIFDRRIAQSGNRPGSINAQSNGTSQTYQFATSLEQLRGFIASQEDGPREPLEPSAVNAWIDMRLALHGSEADPMQWTRLGVAAAGVDVLVNQDLLVGIAAQLDWLSDQDDDTSFSGSGYLVGPYASIALSENLSLDLALLAGGSTNEASATVGGVTYLGEVDTERLLATAGLGGFFELDEFVLRPSATFFLSSERSGDYVVTDPAGNAIPIPSQEILDLQLRGGLTIERAIDLENGATLTPMLGLNLSYGGTLADGGYEDGVTGGIMGGLLYDAGTFSAKGSIEAEFGPDGFQGATGRLSITGRF